MPGDYSRLSHQPNKHFSSVRMQQGRVQLDSDWNEQADITRRALETAVQDLLGQTAALAEGGGFEIKAVAGHHDHPPAFTIGPGRFYVDGVVCANDGSRDAVHGDAQPHYPPARPAAGVAAGAALRPGAPERASHPDSYLVFLDAWQEEVTAVEDADLQEVALGGFDTAARLKTVWQVKLAPIPAGHDKAHAASGDAGAGIPSAVPPGRVPPDLAHNKVEPADVAVPAGPGAGLPDDSGALGLASSSHMASSPAVRRTLDDAEVKALRETAAARAARPRTAEKPEVAAAWKSFCEAARVTGGLKARLPRPDVMTVENQLYRVEVHEVRGDASDATLSFKWSRDNGSVAFAITEIRDADAATQKAEASAQAADAAEVKRVRVTLRDLGTDPLALQPRDWVEIVDDASALHGQVLPLLKVESVDWAHKQVFLIPDAPWRKGLLAEIERGHPRLRRWDREIPDVPQLKEQERALQAVKIGQDVGEKWVELENDLQVCFVPKGTYRPGDYWLIPTRVGQPLAWPDDNGSPGAAPPYGPQHHYALLAVLHRGAAGWEAEDCRPLYFAAADLSQRLIQLKALTEAEVEVLHERITGEVERLDGQVDRLDRELMVTRNHLQEVQSRVNKLESYLPGERTRLFQDFEYDGPIEDGSVMAFDPHHRHHVAMADRTNARRVIGVVHLLPDLPRLPPGFENRDARLFRRLRREVVRRPEQREHKVRVVVYGTARCRVIGRVKPGDRLVPSRVPGHACHSWWYTLFHPAAVIGRAMTGHEPAEHDEPGLVEIIVTLG